LRAYFWDSLLKEFSGQKYNMELGDFTPSTRELMI